MRVAPLEHAAAAAPSQALWVHPHANREIVLRGVRVAYECRRSARRTLGLLAGPQGLSVRAPRGATWADIEAFLQHKADWVLTQWRRLAERPRPAWPPRSPALIEQARQRFAERVAHYAPLLGVAPARLRVSDARTRWGSASSRGTIALNWRLVCLPPTLLDYVVVHELAHLREMNHGPAFWALVAAVLPDYAQRRAALHRHPLR